MKADFESGHEKKEVDRSVRHYLKRLSASSKLNAVPEDKPSENEEYAEPDYQRSTSTNQHYSTNF